MPRFPGFTSWFRLLSRVSIPIPIIKLFIHFQRWTQLRSVSYSTIALWVTSLIFQKAFKFKSTPDFLTLISLSKSRLLWMLTSSEALAATNAASAIWTHSNASNALILLTQFLTFTLQLITNVTPHVPLEHTNQILNAWVAIRYARRVLLPISVHAPVVQQILSKGLQAFVSRRVASKCFQTTENVRPAIQTARDVSAIKSVTIANRVLY
jgi:hypothetical protein